MEKIKVIIKRPDEPIGHIESIDNDLKALQDTVGGFIQCVPIGNTSVMICNEEGKIHGLPFNFHFGVSMPDEVVGTVVICGVDGEEFADVPYGADTWGKVLELWGNET